MPKVIVSDTSCLILLEKLEHLDVLKNLFGQVSITQIIADEFGLALPDFFKIENPKNSKYQTILETFLDKGEASSIALCIEKEESLLIIDDLKGRYAAEQLKINYTGSIGILILSKQKGYIDSIRDEFNKLRTTDFRISDTIVDYAIKICNE
jgi:predicted nucleic acid-binding protein